MAGGRNRNPTFRFVFVGDQGTLTLAGSALFGFESGR
jgi:hypothetical protein